MHRMLLVDDEADIVDILSRGLELKGMLVDAYSSPRQALQAFKPNLYDLAILDIRMPVLSGFQLYREMKKIDPAITVCFLSAFEMYSNEFKSMFPSMNDVKTIIKKPISINELLKQITPSLKISALARAVPGEHILVVFETHKELVEQALECLKIGLLEKEEDVMLVTDAIPVDRIRNKISSEWNIDIDSMEENGRIRLSTFHDWHKTDGKFELQKSITRLRKKLEQSLARGRKGFRCFEDMSPFFSLDSKHEGLRYESVLEKKFDLPLVAICAYTRQSIEQLDSPAIELLHQHHSRLIGSP
jgi:two-component system catabolic regulation response regulator CreB/two-component system response regulator ChvI